MAYPSAHYLLSFGGGLPGGEEWSTSLRFTGSDPGTLLIEQALCEEYDAVVVNWFTTYSELSDRNTHQWTKFNYIGTNGRYVYPFTALVDHGAGATGPYTETEYPNQIAIVVTMHTALGRGRASKGRMFLPIPGAGINASTGILESTDRNVITSGMVTFIEALNAVNALGFATVMSSLETGAQALITGVSVGRVLDTMRSRRTSLEETRVVSPITFP